MTIPELFALARGTPCSGPHACVYCGAPASDPWAVPDSFTARDTLAAPSSRHACRGCILCLEEAGEAVYPDGARKAWTKAFRRMNSWVVSAAGVVAATKAHLPYLRGVLLAPPPPPWGVSLAVSGQRQILYRGVANLSAGAWAVTLEGERVGYTPAALAGRLDLCGKICAAAGRPALDEPPGPSVWFRVCGRYAGGESLCEEWAAVRESPLTRLAVFLTPKKEDCEREHPGDGRGGIPPAGGRTCGPDPAADRGRGSGLRQGRGEATLFDDV